MNKGFRLRFLFFVLPLVACGFIIMIGIGYRTLGGALEKALLENAINRTEAAADRLADGLEIKAQEKNITPREVAQDAALILPLTERVRELWFGDSGYSFVIDQEGNYLGEGNAVGASNIFAEKDQGLQELGRRTLSSKAGLYRFLSLDGGQMIALHYPVAGTDCGMATVIREKELFAPARDSLKLMALLGLALWLLLSYALVLAANKANTAWES